MKHYSQLPQFSNLVQFNELSNESKLIAISEILHGEEIWFSLYKNEYLNTFKNSIHSSINNRSKYIHLLRRGKFIKELKTNAKCVEMYIIENICRFTSNGEYIYYSQELKSFINNH